MKKTDVITTKSGKIQGYSENGLQIFKGIPFAEPPVGELRFKPPIAKKPWGDIIETTKYGACAFQGYSELEEWIGKPGPESEDCLYLNVWTPATDAKKRPVMVWFHGGAFFMGTASDPMYDGSALARRGDVVIVTVNYRLGFFGFPYIPGKVANLGSLDQILALKWVHDNIKLFGGDPNTVTIFGESAGGYSVVSLCSMPAAKGLFRRVIAESAPMIDPAVSDKVTVKILRKLGVTGDDLGALREKSPQEIIAVQNKIFASDPTNIMALRPVIEGKIWPKHPLKAFQDGDCADIEFMIGTNLDELKLFTAMKVFRTVAAGGDSILAGFLGTLKVNPEKSKEIIKTYKETRADKDLFGAILTDITFRISTIRLLEAQSPHQPHTYSYLFTWPSPQMNGILGACHAIELPFVFGTLDAPTFKNLVVVNQTTKALSEKVMDAWIAFARTGNPSHKNLPDWPAYDAKKRATMALGESCQVINAPFDKERAAWDGLLQI